MTQLVDVIESDQWDVYIGRARRKALNPRLKVDHEFTAPYVPHRGRDDWREHAQVEYRKHLVRMIQRPEVLKRFEDLRNRRLGVWGDFGLEMGQVVVNLLNELQRWPASRLAEDIEGAGDE